MKNIISIPECKDCAIGSNSLFLHLTPEQLAVLNFDKGCDVYKRGNIIYHEGSRVNGVYCVNKGIVKLYKTGLEGREQIIRFAQKGEMIGYRSLLSGEHACHSAKVLEDAVLCYIPGEILFELLRKNSEFAIALLQFTCRELGEANSFITEIAQKTVRERLAEVLFILKSNFGIDNDGVLQISLTREELANMIGTATESVIRLLSEFKDDNLIEINGRKIKLLNQKLLKKTANIYD
ncbi:MAG: Crp/Fnr family transcriptional regulator [Bacteroidetes bacterium CG02_land_8_20_14_3_00_31_25]|nr:Crp/Fnr family transcriptional regulator [Bacteroidota bacterium]PIV62669.1 MAG: Crp/Fnr family transcriptional regulator [Bacteroidetes bacterium CG02_land_8_20_14_3_00_31_25]PIX33525.1 MAG: Crp/Fnr family transcriptional regulator [Bacteroidetes bacterium CG_4_8_14_3_um_filter_31_14]PIY04057.1 MAG: Crp/Fnr family transcriptional regulator [Bacteroidetes bacterium CG_4_10_14_3_um_filter_31_20]